MKNASKIALVLLLVVPAFLNLFTPLYNRINPEIGGIPFFYWFQIVLLVLCIVPYLVFSYVEKRCSD